VIIVRKPTEEEKKFMQKQETWGCEASEFDWSYSSQEEALIVEGEVSVEYEGAGESGKKVKKSVSFGTGNYVIFPKGLSCFWKVKKAVNKYYVFK
jgi:uncharacterized cupin superfamily protein